MKMEFQPRGSMIDMDYAAAISQAERLDALAEELKRTRNSLADSCGRLGESWQGDAARQYCGKGQQLAEKLREDARQLKNTADAIRRIAKRMREAEEMNEQLGRDRRY